MTDITQNAINLTRQLVKIPSESSDPIATSFQYPEAGIASKLEDIYRAHEISWKLQETQEGRYNIISFFPNPGRPKVLFMAHMDTVTAQGMKNPFEGEIRDKKIWGRGSCDDKGSLATIVSVLLGLKEEKVPLQYDVTLVGTVDEECRMTGSAKYASENSDGWDLCVAMEPSLLKPISTHIGVYRSRIIFTDSAASNSSSKLPGDRVLNLMSEVAKKLQQFEKKICGLENPKLGRAVMTVTEFKGNGGKGNIIDPLRILVDIRILPGQSPAWIHGEITKIVGNRGKVVPLFTALGIDTDPDQIIIKSFQKSIASHGICDDLIGVRFPSDCSQLRSKCAALVWGPGNSTQAHKPDEFVEVDQIDKGCRILYNFLTDSGKVCS